MSHICDALVKKNPKKPAGASLGSGESGWPDRVSAYTGSSKGGREKLFRPAIGRSIQCIDLRFKTGYLELFRQFNDTIGYFGRDFDTVRCLCLQHGKGNFAQIDGFNLLKGDFLEIELGLYREDIITVAPYLYGKAPVLVLQGNAQGRSL